VEVEPSTAAGRPRAPLSLGAALGIWIAGVGLIIGMRPLFDNSFLTHLATGRLILDTGTVPSADPYSFTALGEPWVVQSWAASWFYATTESVGGSVGLRLAIGAVAAAVALVAWRLTRPAEAITSRLGMAALVLAVGGGLWAERPLMFGLLGLALVALVGDRGLDARWLVPIGWIWANIHGSFPLGVTYLLVLAVGSRVDGGRPWHELRAAVWLTGGVALGAVGPLGPRVLTFPFELLQRQEVLQHVVEWQAPSFDSFGQRAFLLQLMVAVVLLVRRPSYRRGLVMAVYVAAALLGSRNIAVASILLLPGMAEGATGAGALLSERRDRLASLLVLVGGVLVVVALAVRLDQPHFDLQAYPVDAVAFLETSSVSLEEHRLAAPDVVGNYLGMTYGPRGLVFYDDRFDMFPEDVSAAHLALVEAAPEVQDRLAGLAIDLVLWRRSASIAQLLATEPAWRAVYIDESWVVLSRRGSEADGLLR
jgi:hypothetical protein